jgi:hypothetical protein
MFILVHRTEYTFNPLIATEFKNPALNIKDRQGRQPFSIDLIKYPALL